MSTYEAEDREVLENFLPPIDSPHKHRRGVLAVEPTARCNRLMKDLIFTEVNVSRWHRKASRHELVISPGPFHTDPASYQNAKRPNLFIATPSPCSSRAFACIPTTSTPLPDRETLKMIAGDVKVIFFDFDGTLTASPGDQALRCRKQTELCARAPLLASRLLALREAGIMLGIISKSTEKTINGALHSAGLAELFNGPLFAKAVSFDGKAGFIEEFVHGNSCHDFPDSLRPDSLHRVMLVDDDVFELDRARLRGIQTYAAPIEGGLQEQDFDQIFLGLGLPRKLCRSHSVQSWHTVYSTSPLMLCSTSPTQHLPLLPPLPPFSLWSTSPSRSRSESVLSF